VPRYTTPRKQTGIRVDGYALAVGHFADWCQEHKLRLDQLMPFFVAAYIEELQTRLSPPSVTQNLAAIRMLFDYLVTGQVVPVNPATSVRGPKYVVKRGKTPVLTPDQTRVLLDSIDISTVAGLRDRALVGVMVYSFARVSAVVGMNVED
jgi:site-specific recombinase XerD